MMELISNLPQSYVPHGSYLTEERLRKLESDLSNVSKDNYITLEQFQKIISSKNIFFIKRIFKICDENDSGRISIDQFIRLVRKLVGNNAIEKLKFIFQMYDIDGDEMITSDEMQLVIKSCMEENGLDFAEEEIDELSNVIFENVDTDRSAALSFEEFRFHLNKYPGLIENLAINVETWLLPLESRGSKVRSRKRDRILEKFSWSHIKNNYVNVGFLVLFLAVNVVLFVTRALQYYDRNNPNFFVVFARACGQCINFCGTLLFITVFRRSITFLRSIGFSAILPLDNHIYYHKLIGCFVFIYGIIHSLMHIFNFTLIVPYSKHCNQTTPCYTAVEYLFYPYATSSLGLVKGYACISGWILLIISLIIIPFAQPCIRRSGKFELFYYTHLLYIPFLICLIIHGPNFWKWFLIPGFIFLFEWLRKIIWTFSPLGLTNVEEGTLLPSRVVHLAIKRPEHFDYSPGDYVFVNIPSISKFEWHPFTISSAPEQSDIIWLHIRAVGKWTNHLMDYFLVEELVSSYINDRTDGKLSVPSQPPNYRKSVMKHALLRKSIVRPPLASIMKSKNGKSSASHLLDETDDTIKMKSIKPPPPKVSFRRKSTVFLFTPKVNEPVYENINKPLHSDVIDMHDGDSGVSLRVPTKSDRSTEKRKTQHFGKVEDQKIVNTGNHLKIRLDGPYGSPSSRIFSTQHAVLVATGIGVTPFASILQSVMQRYLKSRHTCPNCAHQWSDSLLTMDMRLRKVDFVWINREQKSFEWFVNLLAQLELQQGNLSQNDRILNIHMYVSSAADKSDIKTLGLQLALDLMHEKNNRCFITGLKSRTHSGRPNWDTLFTNISKENTGEVTVFFCGAPQLAKTLRNKCDKYSFIFRKEVF